MHDQDSHDLTRIVDSLLMLVHEASEYQAEPEVRAILKEAVRALVGARRRLAVAADRYIVAVVGLTNVGKSTLLNALLGLELAPRRNGPCTAAPIEFTFGNELCVTVCYRGSLSRPSWRCEDVEAVHEKLTSLAADTAGRTSLALQQISVKAPVPLLGNGLVIADTPGFGAAQLGEDAGSHESALKSYLQNEISQVFWVVLAEQGIGKREKNFCDEFFADVCDDVIVTGAEDWEANDRQRFRQRYADAFGNRMPRFHFVSGLKGAEARRAKDAEALEAAGIPMLESRIRELADPAGRLAAVQNSLHQLAEDLTFWLARFRDRQRQPLRVWWRPDSWARWRATLSNHPLHKRLTEQLQVTE